MLFNLFTNPSAPAETRMMCAEMLLVRGAIAPDIKEEFEELMFWEYFSNPRKRRYGLESLISAKHVFGHLNIPFWLWAGTLLGLIRDGGFIAHDRDIDIAVWDDAIQHNKITNALVGAGFKHTKEYGKANQPGHQLCFTAPGGIPFDVFFCTREGARCWSPYWRGTELSRFYYPLITHLVQRKFHDEIFEIPENYEDCLVAQYGRDWRRPEALWDGDAAERNHKNWMASVQ
jgi:LicD family